MDIETLRRSLSGTLVIPEDADWSGARGGLIWNGRKPGRSPRAIVRAASVPDVQAAVRFAAHHGLHVSVRGRGHNWSGIALQAGLVLDLSALGGIAVDAAARLAEVGPAVTSGDLARALAGHGLAFPVGHCATVPMSGYLLGGGLGWNFGHWRPATLSIESADVVLADGSLRRASATENPEIFWALRGGGPEFFGVVTAFRLRLQPLPRAITTSVRTYPLARIAEIEAWATAAMQRAPSTVELTLLTTRAPEPLADRAATVVSAIATVFADTAAEAQAALGQIAEGAPADALDVQEAMPTPFEVLFDIIARFYPEGRRYAADAFWSGGDTGGFLHTLARRVGEAAAPESFTLGVVLPPSFAAAPSSDAAFSMQGRIFAAAYAIWQDPAEDEAQVRWLRETSDALAPATVGHYVGEADLERPGRLRACYGPAAWEKLKALQATYDPAGLFAATGPGAEAPAPYRRAG